MPTSIDITFTHYNRPPTENLHFRVLTCVFQVHLLWRTNECADIRIFSSQLLPARISIFDQNQEAEIFKFRWCRQSEFKNQLNLTSKILTRMLHITNITYTTYTSPRLPETPSIPTFPGDKNRDPGGRWVQYRNPRWPLGAEIQEPTGYT